MHNATCSPSPPRLHHTLLLHNIRWGGTAHRAARTSTGRASRPTSTRRRQRSWRPRGCAPAWRRRGAPRNKPAAEWVAHRVELKEQHPQAACGWRGSQQAKRPPEGGWRCIASDNSCNWPVRKASPLARAQQQGVPCSLCDRHLTYEVVVTVVGLLVCCGAASSSCVSYVLKSAPNIASTARQFQRRAHRTVGNFDYFVKAFHQ